MAKYYGLYRGMVVDSRDPEGQGRLRIELPAVFGEQASAWAVPCVPFASQSVLIPVPAPGTPIWVAFEEGDAARPVWLGTMAGRWFTGGVSSQQA